MPPLGNKDRTCVIGLDGVPHSLLMQLVDQGVMPELRTIIAETGSAPKKMRVTIPEISSVSWTSFATGVNPGVHGIYGFVDLKPESYDIYFPDYRHCRAKTIWQKVGSLGGRSVVINQPFTYPAKTLKGNMVTGFVSADYQRSYFPRSLGPVLKRLDYKIDIDTERCRSDHELLWKQLFSTLKNRTDLARLLWNENWNYFQLVITGTDRLFHYLWNACVDAGHKYYSRAMEYFGAIDRFLGWTYQRFSNMVGAEAASRFFLLSDHGFCALEKEININAWLQQEGYLRFRNNPPESLSDITDDSIAFCLDPGRVYMHTRDRFPRGSLDAHEAARLRREISDGLAELQHNDRPVFRKVLNRAEVYAGPLESRAPDLVGLAHYGYDLKGTLTKRSVFTDTDLQGMHTWDDAFFLSGAKVSEPLMIWDIADTVLNSLTSD